MGNTPSRSERNNRHGHEASNTVRNNGITKTLEISDRSNVSTYSNSCRVGAKSRNSQPKVVNGQAVKSCHVNTPLHWVSD
jgi:hypothetical protein